MRRLFKLGCAVLAAVPVVALAACSSGGGSGVASGPPPEVSSIVVDAVPTADEAGLYIAQDNGYFKAQGLNVTIVAVPGGEPGLPNLQDGSAQLLAGNYVSFILAQIAGRFGLTPASTKPISLRIIADGSQMQPGNQAIYVMPDSKVKTVADLVKYRATVAFNSPNNVGQVFFRSLFSADGLNFGKIKQVFSKFPDTLGALAGGKIDAAWLPEPFGTIAQQAFGAVPIADFDQGSLQNFPIGAYIGTSQWIQAHPNTVAAFLHALQEGQEVADTSRSEAEHVLVKYTLVPNGMSQGEADQIASLLTLNSYPLAMDVPTMQRVSDAMFEFGLEPGYTLPYNLLNMIQPEPGMIR